jgi:hypothetical protein
VRSSAGLLASDLIRQALDECDRSTL